MAVSTNCWKYLVLVYDVFFAMSAVALFGVGGYLLYQLYVYRHFVGVSVGFPAILLVVIGILSCSVAWMGWKSSWSMHRFHIAVYGILLAAIVAAEFGCFVWSMVIWERLDLDVKTTIDEYFSLAFIAKDQQAASRWDRLQYQMQCCGVGGSSDYRKASSLPYSCCGQGPLTAGPAAAYAADCSAVFQRGCASPVHRHASTQLLIVAVVALVAALVQSFGVFCAFCLVKSIQQSRRQSIQNRSLRNSTLPAEEALLHASAPLKY